jgi:D-alanyl-D-alanine dipeptidase
MTRATPSAPVPTIEEQFVMLLTDPPIVTIHTAENHEPLIDLRDVPELWLDERLADEHGAYARLRTTVVDRLVSAQRRLPYGVRLLIIEGYRPRRPGEADLADPHHTGGAVDLTLCNEDAVELDLGSRVNDSPEASANACYTAARNISATALRNRATLWGALRRVGLTNFPTEWWHWSYGDRYWALNNGVPNTLYAPVTGTLS